jgi:Cof subfamily protein (haloacid dehalogenase superfamily)
MRLKRIPYKLLVVDIDGTLLDKHGALSAEDREALAKVRRSGIRVSLSTGRASQACRKLIDQLSLDGYHMFCDGALVSDPITGQEVYAQPISAALVRQIVEFVHLNEMHMDLFSSSRYFVERETWASDIRREFFGLQPVVVDFNQLWRQERIIKGTLVVRSLEEKARVEQFRQHFSRRLSLSMTKTPAYPEVDFINVLTIGVSKQKALEALARHLGIAMVEIMAIGDGANDVSILSAVGLGVAMGNAADEVKAVADYVTLDVDHSGVAAAIKRFLL